MIRIRHKLFIQALRILDQAFLVGVLALLVFLRFDFSFQDDPNVRQPSLHLLDFLGLLILIIGWICIFQICIGYQSDRLSTFKTQIRDFANAVTLAAFWLLAISIVFSIESINTFNLLIFWLTVMGFGILSRAIVRWFLAKARKSGYNYRYLLIIGANDIAKETSFHIKETPELGYKIVGYVAEGKDEEEPNESNGDIKRLGSLNELQEILGKKKVDEILVCFEENSLFTDLIKVIQNARELGVVVRVVPSPKYSDFLKYLHVEQLGENYIATFFREKMILQLLLKRIMDIVVSIIALIFLLPLFVIIGILVKLTSKGPVFFVQKRVGMNKRIFPLFKFRSMVVDAESRKSSLSHLNERDGPVFKIENDPRITTIGRFIRKTSIDELPQFWNVLKGEMSVVGPRPPTPDEVDKYEWLFHKRLSVKPGITCLWQVSGRKEVTFEEWMQLDKDYIENWSIWLDIKIFFMTIPVVLLGKGAS